MSFEILTPAEMYRADRLTIAHGTPEQILIERAGRAVAEEIARRFGARKTVALCGPGNNGQDGRVAAKYLKAWGWPVAVSDDASGAELIIDAIYGAGLNRDFPQKIADRVRDLGAVVVAIDVPSGLDGLTGYPRGACIKADLTITFVRKKPAHLLYPGRKLCGEVVVADIGITDHTISEVNPQLWENRRPYIPTHAAESHKFRKGHAIVYSGGAFGTGAARLAARACLKSGTGVVSIAGSAAALQVHANHVSAIMLHKVRTNADWKALLRDGRITALCIGPAAGVGAETRKRVLAALATTTPVVLDADALTSFSAMPQTLFKAIHDRHAATILTPHEGEFERLFPEPALLHTSKVERTRSAAALSGAIVLLKGPDTVIANRDGRAVINSNGTEKLATAGSGDVLAGITAGLLAQGMEAFDATCSAAWLHAEAAKLLTRPTAEDLVAAL